MNQTIKEELRDLNINELQEIKTEVQRLIFLNQSMRF